MRVMFDPYRAWAGVAAIPDDSASLRRAFLKLALVGAAIPMIDRAIARARDLRTTPERVLIGEGIFHEDAFYRAVAMAIGARFEAAPRLAPISGADVASAWRAGAAPAACETRFVVAPEGAALARLLERSFVGEEACAPIITAPSRFRQALATAAGSSLAERAAMALPDAAPALSIRDGASRGQILAGCGVLAAVAVFAWAQLALLAIWLAALAGPVFILASAIRLEAALTPRPKPPGPPIPDAALPVYSVVVAAYREADVVADLVAALSRLDYPPEKLDVIIVLEEDDHDTLAALRRAQLRSGVGALIAPDGRPRTKPRALNIALPFARGDFIVVYDAEDRPDPDQLRRAVAAFARNGPDLACLQARLEIDNERDGWLARAFALEYAALFGAIQPGLAAMGEPIFLGGSSNHFRVSSLRAVGGWDAWNVTEDADLGVRLARLGHRVAALDSATGEEAPNCWGVWAPQRVRWLKGWMQTALTHLRDPARLLADLGPARTATATATMVATVLGPLIYPVTAPLILWALVSGRLLDPAGVADLAILTLATLVLAYGLAGVVVPCVVGAVRRRDPGLLWALPTLPLYYVAVSYAAWRAVWELIRKPQGWNKTTHGLSTRRRPLAVIKPVTGSRPAPPSPSR